MSKEVPEALDRSLREVDRVWDATDKFDAKVLQFVSIVAAGGLAAAALFSDNPTRALAPPWQNWATAFLVLGTLSLALFLIQASEAVLRGRTFSGPVNPEKIANEFENLKDDEVFAREAANWAKAAFTKSLTRHHEKWTLFNRSLKFFYAALIWLSLASIVSLVAPTPTGVASSMARGTEVPSPSPSPAPTPSAPQPPAPAPSPAPAPGTYDITRGDTGSTRPSPPRPR